MNNNVMFSSKNSAPFPSMVVIFGEKGGRLL